MSNDFNKEINNIIVDDNNYKKYDELIIKILSNCNLTKDDKLKSKLKDLQFIFKSNLQDNSFINYILNKFKEYSNSSSFSIFQRKNILSLIKILIETNPIKFLNYTENILGIFQQFFSSEYSQLFPIISQQFGEMINIELSSLNNKFERKIKLDNEILLIAFNKYKLFCIYNIQSNSITYKICGTLCLTAFIENCSFIYNTNDKLKEIFNILMNQLDKQKEIGRLEILNCLTSLIFCSEIQYIPFAKCTAKKIIDLCTAKEWIIKKFALNIIYYLIYYCKEEILSLKNLILSKINLLKDEKSPEIKELYELINNNLIDSDKFNNENKIWDINYKKNEEINLENNKKTNKNIENLNFIIVNYDNHLITDPDNINKLNKNNIGNSVIINNINNDIFSPIMEKKNKSKIRNITDTKKINEISRSKSFRQKNINKLKCEEFKNKIKKAKIFNKVGKIISYCNIIKDLGNNDIKILGFKNRNNFKKNNHTINNSKISVNNRIFFIKNYSLMYKPNIIKNRKEKKYNKTYLMKRKKYFSQDKKQKRKFRHRFLNNVNITQNVINDYSTYINNNNFDSFKKIALHKSYKHNAQKKKNVENILKGKKIKTNFINNCISSKFLKDINLGLYKKNLYKIICKQNDETNKKINSYDKGNKKLLQTKINNKYLNKKCFLINKLSSLRNLSKDKKENIKEYSYNNSKNIINKRNNISPNLKNFITSFNKSLFEENNNTVENKSAYISKKIRKIQNLNILESSTFDKRNNYHNIIKKNIYSKLLKEKKNNNDISIQNLKSIKSDKESSKVKNSEKDNKLFQIKSIKNKSKLNELLFNNNSISMSSNNKNKKQIYLKTIGNNKINNN